jgi:hypothetical protein
MHSWQVAEWHPYPETRFGWRITGICFTTPGQARLEKRAQRARQARQRLRVLAASPHLEVQGYPLAGAAAGELLLQLLVQLRQAGALLIAEGRSHGRCCRLLPRRLAAP